MTRKEDVGTLKLSAKEEKTMKGYALPLKDMQYDWCDQNKHWSEEARKKVLALASTNANQKKKERWKIMSYPQKAGKICLRTNPKSWENHSKGSNEELDKTPKASGQKQGNTSKR